MGQAGTAVISPELAVHGIGGLSDCDASVIPTMVGGNTSAPTVTIVGKGADLIKARA